MSNNGRGPRPELKEDHQPEETYSVQVGGKTGLQMISVLAKSDREAVRKLANIAGDNRVHTETFAKNGARLPRSRWQNQL